MDISWTTALVMTAICVVIVIGVTLIERRLVPKSLVERLDRAKQVRQRLADGATVNEIVADLGCPVRVGRALKRRFELDDPGARWSARADHRARERARTSSRRLRSRRS
jgi:hypothetical protein